MDQKSFVKMGGDHVVDLTNKNMIRKDHSLAVNRGVIRECDVLGI